MYVHTNVMYGCIYTYTCVHTVILDLPPPAPSETFLGSLYSFFSSLFKNLSFLLLFAVSLVLVAGLCCCCLACQFEYRRKKYMAWKSQPSSGDSTPNRLGMTVEKTYIPLEDIDTVQSSLMEEELIPLVRKSRRNNRRRLKFNLSGGNQPRKKDERFLSLPASPFLTRHTSPSTVMPTPTPTPLITAQQVKRALAAKSRRYRRGDLRPRGGRPPAPAPTPTFEAAAKQRSSRSLSDILCYLRQQSEPAPKRKRPPKKVNLMKKPHDSSLSSSAKSSSVDTLRASSVASGFTGEPELEYDLYDCDLDNVVAGQPGSFFAQQPPLMLMSWDDDLPTPTVTENCMFAPDDVSPAMIRSRTSDLTDSVTSAELVRMSAGLIFGHADCEGVGGINGGDSNSNSNSSADRPKILSSSSHCRENPPLLLNLTHIDDDISFADSSDENLDHVRKKKCA